MTKRVLPEETSDIVEPATKAQKPDDTWDDDIASWRSIGRKVGMRHTRLLLEISASVFTGGDPESQFQLVLARTAKTSPSAFPTLNAVFTSYIAKKEQKYPQSDDFKGYLMCFVMQQEDMVVVAGLLEEIQHAWQLIARRYLADSCRSEAMFQFLTVVLPPGVRFFAVNAPTQEYHALCSVVRYEDRMAQSPDDWFSYYGLPSEDSPKIVHCIQHSVTGDWPVIMRSHHDFDVLAGPFQFQQHVEYPGYHKEGSFCDSPTTLCKEGSAKYRKRTIATSNVDLELSNGVVQPFGTTCIHSKPIMDVSDTFRQWVFSWLKVGMRVRIPHYRPVITYLVTAELLEELGCFPDVDDCYHTFVVTAITSDTIVVKPTVPDEMKLFDRTTDRTLAREMHLTFCRVRRTDYNVHDTAATLGNWVRDPKVVNSTRLGPIGLLDTYRAAIAVETLSASPMLDFPNVLLQLISTYVS